MANALTNFPISLDTDITSFRNAAAVTSTNCTQGQGIRVTKLALVVGTGGVSTGGNVSITAPSDGSLLYPILAVPGGQNIDIELFLDQEVGVSGALTWRDFAVTGLTATGTRLLIWYKV